MLANVQRTGAPLIISGAYGGALRSFNLDGTPGPLQELNGHVGWIMAMAIVYNSGAPLVVAGGKDGALRSWPVGNTLAALEGSAAREVEVRELSLGSLEVVLQLPVGVLAAASVTAAGVTVMKLTTILHAIKRLAGFPADLRLQRTQLEVEQLRAEAERLDQTDGLAEARARHRRRQLEAAGWELDSVVVTDEDDAVIL